MQFQTDKLGEYTRHILYNQITEECIAIVPDFGATLHAFRVKGKDSKLFDFIDGYETPQQMEEEIGRTFKGTKLSPFANRVNKGRYNYKGTSYQLDINRHEEGHALHGLLYQAPFKLLSYTADSHEAKAVYHYLYDAESSGFPFRYTLTVTYVLTSGNEFLCTTLIKNTGKQAMPIGDGWHPVFRTDTTVDEVQIKFDAEEQLELNGLIPGQKPVEFVKFNNYQPLGTTTFDHCFKMKEKAGFSLRYESLGLEVNLWQETGEHKYNYLHIFTPEDRQSIAIEPVSCAPDAFNNGKGLKELQPGEEISLSYGIDIGFLKENKQ